MLPNRILAVIKAVHERVPETYARVILGGLGIPGTDASGLTQTDMLYSNITVPSAKVNNFSLTTDSSAAVNTLPVSVQMFYCYFYSSYTFKAILAK